MNHDISAKSIIAKIYIMKGIAFSLMLFFGFSVLNAQVQVNSTSPSQGTYTSCSPTSSTYTGSCGLTYNGSLVWRVDAISTNTVTFRFAKQTSNCNQNEQLLIGGTAYVKADNACGAILSSSTYNAGATTVTASYTFNTPGTYTLVGTLNPSSGTRYFSAPITVVVSESNNYSFTITNPTNQNYNTGSNMVIQWTTTGNGPANVNLELVDANNVNNIITVIQTSVVNDGQFIWSNIPCANIPTGSYKIKIYKTGCTLGGGCPVGYSGSFTITNLCSTPTLVVTSPVLNNSFQQGATLPIAWQTSNYTGNISITLLNASNNALVKTIATNISNSFSYNYQVPCDVPAGVYKIRVFGAGNTSLQDFSGSFNITSNPTCSSCPFNYTINIAQPNGGTYNSGATIPLQWTTTGLGTGDYLSFELWSADGASFIRALFPSPGTINDNAENWVVPNDIASGQYKLKAYKTGVQLGQGCFFAWSNAFTINQTITTPSISVSSPTLNQSVACNGNLVINWSSSNIDPSASLKIELVRASDNAFIRVIISSTLNTSSYQWTSVPTDISTGTYKVKVSMLSNPSVLALSASFNISCTPQTTCIIWQSGGAPTGSGWNAEYASAFDYLCSKYVINQQQFANQINNALLREELAKITFRGLFLPTSFTDIGPTTIADNFPTIYPDLKPTATNYVREARTLLYLEYKNNNGTDLDGISPFDRDNAYFNPKRSIQRRFVLKVLMEAFNIKPTPLQDVAFPAGVFTDVQTNDETRGYIHKALSLGIIISQSNFRPYEDILRKDAILILSRLMKLYDNGLLNPRPSPAVADYFVPNNFDIANFGRMPGIEGANFNSYTKTSFGIAGLLPLAFAHSYNSILTELPKGFFDEQPLGVGWTHNYYCYIRRTADDQGNNKRVTVMWGDGTANSFLENGSTYTPETAGLYVTLTASGNTLVYKTKSQMQYTFTAIGSNFWGLTEMKDRNNNKLILTWETGFNAKPRIVRVTEPGGRYLLFSYEIAGTNLLTRLTAYTGSIVRQVSFTYTNGNTDLHTYTDPRGNVTTYYYGDINSLTESHLLVKIKLPKGNVVDNSYEHRKLKSSEFVGQYKSTVSAGFNYSSADPGKVMQSVVSSTRNGQTLSSSINADVLGNPRSITTPTGSLTMDYDPVHKTRPAQIVNSVNNLNAGMTYDANGNVLTVTKTGQGVTPITEQFTYTAFNDIATYRNGRGFTTRFGYTNGNLTSITDALNNVTTIEVNSDGTVKKVTNPESIFTSFEYDLYGNTTRTSLMNAINTLAKYDDASRLIESTNPNGVKTKVEYELNDLVKKVISDAGNLNNTVSYAYDANDNLTGITNPKGGLTTLKYNELDQLVEYEFAGFKKTYAYNEDGTLKTFTSQRNDIFNYVYAPDGTLTDDGYATYTYDGDKNLKTITHKTNGKVIAYEYDGFKRVRQIKYNDPANGANGVMYDYDANNNVIAITYPDGFKVGYEYDALDRLTRVYRADNNATYATYSYLKDGRLVSQTNGNGTKTVYLYDTYGRLDSLGNIKSDNSTIAGYRFTMDLIGNHLEERETMPNAPALPPMADQNISYAHDAANRMTARGTSSFAYDGNGNNTQAAGEWNSTYTYDAKDNLLTSTNPLITAEYDGMENRRLKNNTRYVLDILGGSNVLMETNLSGVPQAYYIHGLGLICRLDAAKSNPHYFHYDYRGSTVAVTNSAQNVTHQYRYGAFGEMLVSAENGFSNVYRYVGKYGVQFEDNSLYFMRARYFNPLKGRFMSEDPVWGINAYNYAEVNPIGKIDFDGNFWTSVEDFYSDVKTSWNYISEEVKSAGNKAKAKVVQVYNNTVYPEITRLTEDVIKKFGVDNTLSFLGLAEEYTAAVRDAITAGLGIDATAKANKWYEEQYINSIVNGKENRIFLVGFAMTSMWSSLENAQATLEALNMKVSVIKGSSIDLRKAAGSLWAMQARGVSFSRLWTTYNSIHDLSKFFSKVYNSGGGLGDMIRFMYLNEW